MVPFAPMSDLTIEVATAKNAMADIRPVLDAALQEEFPGGMLKWRWEGDVMHLSGPGATATIVHEEGRLVGRAQLKPPASLMKPVIEGKIKKAMQKGAAA
jgi:Putative polyhydroxyalkanoic acid system protein (PHA_gran_rgn)